MVPTKKGKVTGVASGSATITASYNGVTSNSSITVSAASLTSLEISPTISSASVGVTTQFYATGINDDSTFEDMTSFVSWSSSDSSIASIDASGLLTKTRRR